MGNNQKAEEFLTKAHRIAPFHAITMIKLAKLETKKGKHIEAKQHRENAYDILKRQWENNTLGKNELGWFSSLAYELGHYDVHRQVRGTISSSATDTLYNNDNLTKSI